jgi:hypothetical protein
MRRSRSDPMSIVSTYQPPLRSWMVLCFLVLCSMTTPAAALKHNFIAKDMHRVLVGPLGFPFGFTDTGSYNLTVYDFEISFGVHEDDDDDEDDMDFRRRKMNAAINDIEGVGFLLKRFKDEAEFNHYMNWMADNETRCALEPFLQDEDEDLFDMDDQFDFEDGDGEIVDSAAESGVFLNMKPKSRHAPNTATVYYDFQPGEEGLYFLLYQICGQPAQDIHSKFELDFHFSNLDVLGNESYLSAGEMVLPHMFFYFSLLYAICLYLWVSNIRLIGEGESGRWSDTPRSGEEQPVVYPIHHLMTVLLTLKFLALFFESIRYHFLRVTGHAYFWSGVYYTFAFMKGTFLFTVILLLGSGWSFLKPFLGDREKTMACAILSLQVINNIAIVVLTQKTEGERSFERWTAILHMVDILCCCAVLIPVVWQVNALEKSLEQSGNHNDGGVDDEIIDMQADDLRLPEDEFEEAPPMYGDSRLASKLKLFRSFYLLVVGYIYATRIVVYLFATMLDYRHTWLRHFVIEVVTLAFYVTVGMQFRPMSENPYLTVQQPEGAGNKEVELPTKPSKLKD